MQEAAVSANFYVDETAGIVSAFVSRNAVAPGAVAELISSVHAALVGLSAPVEELRRKLVPAVPIRKSITPDYLISLEDGKRFKSLKRTLKARYGLSPDQYRAKWGLPDDYPMVAPNYSKKRSEIANVSGLGRSTPPKSVGKARQKGNARRR